MIYMYIQIYMYILYICNCILFDDYWQLFLQLLIMKIPSEKRKLCAVRLKTKARLFVQQKQACVFLSKINRKLPFDKNSFLRYTQTLFHILQQILFTCLHLLFSITFSCKRYLFWCENLWSTVFLLKQFTHC